MKYTLILFLISIPLLTFSQKPKSLSELLWSRVSHCHSMFEDMDEDGIPDFEQIDDSKNGYLHIAGSWPTCGCTCSSTVGAYKNQKGEYTLLQSDQVLCSWGRKISSDKALKKILPPDFGLSDFISGEMTEDIKYPIFFVDFQIPRTGTDTRITIELVPLGLRPEGNELLCFSYKESNDFSNCKSLYRIKDIAAGIKDPQTMNYLIKGEFDKILAEDAQLISKSIGSDDSRFRSKADIQQTLIELNNIYTLYSKIDATEIILGWNKQTSKFFIKEKKNKPDPLSFREFLLTATYWSPMC